LCITQRYDLGMWFARLMVPPTSEDSSTFDENGADHWIRRGGAKPTASEAQGCEHV
jgi:hypothetical protein